MAACAGQQQHQPTRPAPVTPPCPSSSQPSLAVGCCTTIRGECAMTPSRRDRSITVSRPERRPSPRVCRYQAMASARPDRPGAARAGGASRERPPEYRTFELRGLEVQALLPGAVDLAAVAHARWPIGLICDQAVVMCSAAAAMSPAALSRGAGCVDGVLAEGGGVRAPTEGRPHDGCPAAENRTGVGGGVLVRAALVGGGTSERWGPGLPKLRRPQVVRKRWSNALASQPGSCLPRSVTAVRRWAGRSGRRGLVRSRRS